MADIKPIPMPPNAVPVCIEQSAVAFTGDHPQSSAGDLVVPVAKRSSNIYAATDKAGLFFFNCRKPVVIIQGEFTFSLSADASAYDHTPVDYSVYIVEIDEDGMPLDGRDGRADTRLGIMSSNNTDTNIKEAHVSLLGQGRRVILSPTQALQVVADASGAVRGHVWGMLVNPAM